MNKSETISMQLEASLKKIRTEFTELRNEVENKVSALSQTLNEVENKVSALSQTFNKVEDKMTKNITLTLEATKDLKKGCLKLKQKNKKTPPS